MELVFLNKAGEIIDTVGFIPTVDNPVKHDAVMRNGMIFAPTGHVIVQGENKRVVMRELDVYVMHPQLIIDHK